MSEKQLTVAELMERAAKEGRVEAPRRRRRSLEEGGVSVAELTGSIPVVKAVPSDSRHSAEPIDAPFQPRRPSSPPKDEDATPKKAAPPTEPEPSSAVDDTPPWLSEAASAGDAPSGSFAAVVDPPAPSEPASSELDDTPPWLVESATQEPEPSSESSFAREDDDVPPWLTSETGAAAGGSVTEDDDEVPPWLATANDVAARSEEEDVPPWLVEATTPAAKPEPEEVPPWIISETEEEESAQADEVPPWIITEEEEAASDDTPPWLMPAEEESDAQPQYQYQEQQPVESEYEDTPPWLQPEAEPQGQETHPAEAAASSTPSTDETMVISVVNENDPVRLTTGAFEAITPEQAQAQAAARQPGPQAQETTQMPVVPDAEPPAAEDAGEIHRPDLAAVIPMGGQLSAGQGAAAASKSRERRNGRAATAAPTGPIPGPAPTTAETQVQPVVDTPIPDPEAPAAPRPLPVKREPGRKPAQKEGKVSLLAIIGMTLLAVIIGVALFLGFEMLWRSLAKWIVALLALAVTGGIVGVVHALRTERDFLSMGLAGLAGLAMTFGPMAVAGL
ncbi:MAG: hypothetical protein Q4D83_11270 [Corynebacterium sp.]|nr:hypothetical protein [Corynebacterium sp.]MDO5077848.1 hypothetical protein [Corynebacterium sp.]